MINLFKSSEKFFCIGLGKTGTTSIEAVFKEFNYKLGNQRTGENLVFDWAKRDFKKIMKFCSSAEAFQDVPFCLPYTYVLLDHFFPDAKFILTVRDSAEQWYNSLINFHGKKWGENQRTPPSIEDLKNATYIYKGRPYDTNRILYNTPEEDCYNKEYLIDYYNRHITNVKEYFKPYNDKLIIINVSKKEDYLRLCNFLGKSPINDNFPWLNKT